jgi:hypothetical protein
MAAVKNNGYVIGRIKNPTERVQLEAAKGFNFSNVVMHNFIYKITSKEALELYEKRKKVHKIIK